MIHNDETQLSLKRLSSFFRIFNTLTLKLIKPKFEILKVWKILKFNLGNRPRDLKILKLILWVT